jgi:hypothetical protein
MSAPIRRLATLGLALLLASCADQTPTTPSSSVSFIGSNTSFGFCAASAYCATRLELRADGALFVQESRALPARQARAALSAGEWQALVTALDEARLRALPSVVGCPDCADGGAETLTAVVDGRTTTVTFEYGRALPGLELLLARVRAQRERLASLVR